MMNFHKSSQRDDRYFSSSAYASLLMFVLELKIVFCELFFIAMLTSKTRLSTCVPTGRTRIVSTNHLK